MTKSGSRVKPLFSKVHTFLCSFFPPPNILLDVCGKLEGENIIGEAIKGTPNLWCFEEPPAPLPSLPDRSSPPTTTATHNLLNRSFIKGLEGTDSPNVALRLAGCQYPHPYFG
jgi:hypothetical protein